MSTIFLLSFWWNRYTLRFREKLHFHIPVGCEEMQLDRWFHMALECSIQDSWVYHETWEIRKMWLIRAGLAPSYHLDPFGGARKIEGLQWKSCWNRLFGSTPLILESPMSLQFHIDQLVLDQAIDSTIPSFPINGCEKPSTCGWFTILLLD